jgi:hypothetical protein
MAKAVKVNAVDVEISRVEEKIKEFQDYLKENTIITKVVNGRLKEASEDQSMRHKEIEIQIKMNEAVLRWLPLLKVLREDEVEKKGVETRGDVQVSGIYKNKGE